MDITNIIKKNILLFIGFVVGALGGFLYWRFAGCSSGTCPITSSAIISSLWGALMGSLLFSSLKKEKK